MLAALSPAQVTAGCGDDRGNIIREYVRRNVNYRPTCDAFVTNADSQYFHWNDYNHNGYHIFALVGLFLPGRMDAIRTDWGAALNATAGYRCPDKQNDIAWWEPSQHMRGRAMDVATPASPDDDMYNALRIIGHNQAMCIEPRSQSLDHIHFDYGPDPCLPGW